jgi:hypothetical protein
VHPVACAFSRAWSLARRGHEPTIRRIQVPSQRRPWFSGRKVVPVVPIEGPKSRSKFRRCEPGRGERRRHPAQMTSTMTPVRPLNTRETCRVWAVSCPQKGHTQSLVRTARCSSIRTRKIVVVAGVGADQACSREDEDSIDASPGKAVRGLTVSPTEAARGMLGLRGNIVDDNGAGGELTEVDVGTVGVRTGGRVLLRVAATTKARVRARTTAATEGSVVRRSASARAARSRASKACLWAVESPSPLRPDSTSKLRWISSASSRARNADSHDTHRT